MWEVERKGLTKRHLVTCRPNPSERDCWEKFSMAGNAQKISRTSTAPNVPHAVCCNLPIATTHAHYTLIWQCKSIMCRATEKKRCPKWNQAGCLEGRNVNNRA